MSADELVAALRAGDVVRCRRNGRTHLLEVVEVIAGTVVGRLPYASTYTDGGRYQGSYRGYAGRFADEVVEIVLPAGMRG